MFLEDNNIKCLYLSLKTKLISINSSERILLAENIKLNRIINSDKSLRENGNIFFFINLVDDQEQWNMQCNCKEVINPI